MKLGFATPFLCGRKKGKRGRKREKRGRKRGRKRGKKESKRGRVKTEERDWWGRMGKTER